MLLVSHSLKKRKNEKTYVRIYNSQNDKINKMQRWWSSQEPINCVHKILYFYINSLKWPGHDDNRTIIHFFAKRSSI